MNALILLKQDHQNVEALFERFEHAQEPDERRRIVDKVIEHLSVHAALEEQALYPAIREKLPQETDAVLEALEEHHGAKLFLSELEKLPATTDRFAAKTTVLIEQVRHHVQEEEEELFPKVREAFTVQELEELGERMQELKQSAPTRPHPFQPDVPPLNLIIGLPVAVLDRVITTGKRVLLRR